MTYSIFDSSGNVADVFNERAAALDCLADIARFLAESDAADEVYLVAQDDDGNILGETVYVSSASVPA